MKPTLDEEIRRIAEKAASQIAWQPTGLWEHSVKEVAFAIRAGIEAWKRQEPTLGMLMAGNAASLAIEVLMDDTRFSCERACYRAMMLASLRTSETTGEGK